MTCSNSLKTGGGITLGIGAAHPQRAAKVEGSAQGLGPAWIGAPLVATLTGGDGAPVAVDVCSGPEICD